MNSIEELKRIAEQATPHFTKWKVINFGDPGRPMYEVVNTHSSKDDIEDPSNQYSLFEDPAKEICDHVTAFSPPTVLALIADWENMLSTLKSTVGHEPFGKGDLNPYKITECLQSLQFKTKAGK